MPPVLDTGRVWVCRECQASLLPSQAYDYAINGPQRAPWSRTLFSGQAHPLPAIRIVEDSSRRGPTAASGQGGLEADTKQDS